MSTPTAHRWSISRTSLAFWLAMLLVLSGQVKADAANSALSAVEAVTIFCHAGHDTDHGKPVLPHHVHEVAVLQAGVIGVHHVATAAAAPSLPPPAVRHSARPSVPQARAPPGRRAASASARGPPLPV